MPVFPNLEGDEPGGYQSAREHSESEDSDNGSESSEHGSNVTVSGVRPNTMATSQDLAQLTAEQCKVKLPNLKGNVTRAVNAAEAYVESYKNEPEPAYIATATLHREEVVTRIQELEKVVFKIGTGANVIDKAITDSLDEYMSNANSYWSPGSVPREVFQ